MTKEERAEYYREYQRRNAAYCCEKSMLWQQRNKEHVNAYRRAYYLEHREEMCRKARERAKKRRAEHGDEVRAKQREYYAKSKLKIIRGIYGDDN